MKFRKFLQKIQALPTAVLCLDAAGLIVLAALVAWWWAPGQSFISYAAALLSAILFAVLGLSFMPRWVKAWHPQKEPALAIEKAEPAELARIFLYLLLADAGILLIVYLLRVVWTGPQSFAQSLSFWRCLDSNSYLEIAQYGYASGGDRAVQLVFLPGYPMLVKAAQWVFGGDFVYAGLFVAGVCFAGTGTMLYALVCLDYGWRTARRAVKYLCLFPGVFFYAAPMSESLFLLLTLGCVYCVREKRWFLACVLGCYASFTRTIGLVMLALVCFELIEDVIDKPPRGAGELWRCAGRFAAVLLILAGFGCYLYINYRVTGNPLQFLIHQREHWGQSLGFFFNTAAYQANLLVDSILSGNKAHIWGLWLPQLLASFAALPLLTATCKRLRPSYTAYAIGYYVIAIGCTWLLSAVRYLSALFCVPLSLALLTEKRKTDAIFSVGLGVCSAAYLFLFVIRWQVW